MHVAMVVLSFAVVALLVVTGALLRERRALRRAAQPCRRLHVADLPRRWVQPGARDEDEVNPVLK